MAVNRGATVQSLTCNNFSSAVCSFFATAFFSLRRKILNSLQRAREQRGVRSRKKPDAARETGQLERGGGQ